MINLCPSISRRGLRPIGHVVTTVTTTCVRSLLRLGHSLGPSEGQDLVSLCTGKSLNKIDRFSKVPIHDFRKSFRHFVIFRVLYSD